MQIHTNYNINFNMTPTTVNKVFAHETRDKFTSLLNPRFLLRISHNPSFHTLLSHTHKQQRALIPHLAGFTHIHLTMLHMQQVHVNYRSYYNPKYTTSPPLLQRMYCRKHQVSVYSNFFCNMTVTISKTFPNFLNLFN